MFNSTWRSTDVWVNTYFSTGRSTDLRAPGFPLFFPKPKQLIITFSLFSKYALLLRRLMMTANDNREWWRWKLCDMNVDVNGNKSECTDFICCYFIAAADTVTHFIIFTAKDDNQKWFDDGEWLRWLMMMGWWVLLFSVVCCCVLLIVLLQVRPLPHQFIFEECWQVITVNDGHRWGDRWQRMMVRNTDDDGW